jgi:hypothetical protein
MRFKRQSPKSCGAVPMLASLANVLSTTAVVAAQENSASESVVLCLVSISGVVNDSAGKPVSGSATLTFSLYEFQDGAVRCGSKPKRSKQMTRDTTPPSWGPPRPAGYRSICSLLAPLGGWELLPSFLVWVSCRASC